MSNKEEMPIGLYRELAAACDDYDARAPMVARYVGGLITRKVPAASVEHIGSTAVEGCAGKGVIDLMVLYTAGQLESAKKALDELGFQRQSTRDPFPEDRPMRIGSVEYDGSVFRLHAHVISVSSREADELRQFRDRLSEDQSLREQYVKRKREIIESGVTDTVDYSMAKEEFIRHLLARARPVCPRGKGADFDRCVRQDDADASQASGAACAGDEKQGAHSRRR